MSSFLTSIVAFIFAIGILIAFHEFGHYWVARKMGVKVLRFSIGFGKPLWSKRRGSDNTEFALAAIPLGGYVKMLDEREGEVAESERHRAFNRQTVGKRIAIVAAGPVFNLLFAIVAYCLMYVGGVPGIKPVIGDVADGGVAFTSGLRAGDVIKQVNSENTPTWNSARIAMLQSSLDEDVIALQIQDKEGMDRDVQLDLSSLSTEQRHGNLLQNIGISLVRPIIPPVIHEIIDGGAAQRDGLHVGDRVVSVNGDDVDEWGDWVAVISKNPGKVLHVEVQRGSSNIQLDITPNEKDTDKGVIGYIGAGVKPVPIPESLKAVEQYPFLEAAIAAVRKTWQMSVLTLRMIGKMLIGEVSLKNLSGPITIATYAGYTASEGVTTFLSFLAIVSISLGVLNLLPIPLLDGGHLLYYLIEAVKGSALSESVQAKMQQVGIVLLAMLMVLAFYNDIQRLIG